MWYGMEIYIFGVGMFYTGVSIAVGCLLGD